MLRGTVVGHFGPTTPNTTFCMQTTKGLVEHAQVADLAQGAIRFRLVEIALATGIVARHDTQ